MAKDPGSYKIGDFVNGHELVGSDPLETDSWKFWGAGARRAPSGAIVQDKPSGGYNVLQAAPKTASTQRLTEQQSIGAARANRMLQGEKLYQEAITQGYDPTTPRNKLASLAEAVPVIGHPFADFVRNPVSEKGATAEEQFTEGALRAVTGAGGPKDERPLTKSQFFPTAFQSANPELRQRLDQIRASELATALRIAGPALAKRTDTALPRIQNDADYARLPPNTTFIDPQGKRRVKP